MPRYNPQIINRAMGEKRMSAEVLSELSGVGMTAISQIRNGKQNATDDTLGKIADALGLQMAELYTQPQQETEQAA